MKQLTAMLVFLLLASQALAAGYEDTLCQRFELLAGREIVVVANPESPDWEYASSLAEALTSAGMPCRLSSDLEFDVSMLGAVNIILVGGPIANKATKMLQDNLSVVFYSENGRIFMYAATVKLTGAQWGVVNMEEISGSWVVLLAGITRNGTKAAVKAFLEAKNLHREVAIIRAKDSEYGVYICLPALSQAEKESRRIKPRGAGVVAVGLLELADG